MPIRLQLALDLWTENRIENRVLIPELVAPTDVSTHLPRLGSSKPGTSLAVSVWHMLSRTGKGR